MLTPEQKQELRESWMKFYSANTRIYMGDDIFDHWLSVATRLVEEERATLRAKIKAIDLSTMTYGGFRRKVLEILTNNSK